MARKKAKERHPESPTEPRVFHFDLAAMRGSMHLGARRAAAFVGLTERMLAGPLPSSLNIPAGISIYLLPEPTPADAVEQAATEFRYWVCSNALKELDQFLGLMLDGCWQMVQVFNAKFGGSAPTKARFDLQSVPAKHRRVLEAAGRFAGPLVEDNDHLVTLSEARNCIAHNLGIVDQRRAPSGTFALRWLKFAFRLITPSQTYDLGEVELPFEVPGNEAGQVQIQVVTTERRFALGDRIIVTPHELIQIAMLYMGVGDRLILALEEWAQELGLLPETPQIPDGA